MSPSNISRYNELPSLEEANARRQSQCIDLIIGGPIRDVFVRHNAQKHFGLYLSHSHHHLDEDDALVKVHCTGHVMSAAQRAAIQAVGNDIVPTTWMGPDITPMEFAVVTEGSIVPTVSQAFTTELANVLSSVQCEGLFGIDTLGERNTAEFHIGEASVVVPSNGHESENDWVEVAFAFDDATVPFRVHRKCSKGNTLATKPAPKPVPKPHPKPPKPWI